MRGDPPNGFMKTLPISAAFLWVISANAGARENAGTSAGREAVFPEISAYLSAPGLTHDFQMRSGGHDQYVLPADLARLIETRGTADMLAALARQIGAVSSDRFNRVRDLAVVILSRVKPVSDGWMTPEQKHAHSKAFRIPFATDGKLRQGLPKGNTAAERVAYSKRIEENSIR